MNNLTSKEVDTLLCYLGDLYCRCRVGGRYNEHKRTFVREMDAYLSLLGETQEILLRKTYFEKDNGKWWVKVYSRSTYYRERERASRTFLHCVM